MTPFPQAKLLLVPILMLLGQVAAAQLGPPHDSYPEQTGVTRLPSVDRRERQRFQTAVNYVAEGRDDEAVVYFQLLLDDAPDGFLEPVDLPDAPPEPPNRVRSLRAEVLRQLTLLAAAGSDAYERGYGPTARSMLAAASSAGDFDAVAAVARQFPLTQAGRDAAARLAVQQLDCGDTLAAIAGLERLRSSVTAVQRPALLARLALAYARLPDTAARDRVLQDLENAAELVVWAGESRSVAELPVFSAAPPTTRPSSETSKVASETSKVAWTAAVLADPFGPPDSGSDPRQAAWHMETRHASLSGGLAGVPVAQPLLVGDTLLFRTPCQVVAADAANGQTRWRSLADSLCWDFLTSDADASPFGSVLANRLWSDATWAGIACDGQRVITIEDTGTATFLPPPHREAAPLLPSSWNRLVACDLATGRRIFTAGGEPDEARPLAGTFFLGVPQPVGGVWYVLGETAGTTRLMALDPERPEPLLWSLPVAEHDGPIERDPARRTAGLTPLALGGLLICPVGPGLVLAVDPASRSLLWASRVGGESLSRRRATQRGGNGPGIRVQFQFGGRAKPYSSATHLTFPTLAPAGRHLLVVTPAPDAFYHGIVSALDPLDGITRWQVKVGGVLWPLGVMEQSLFVQTRTGVAALNLDDGTLLWNDASGRPSGRGLLVDRRIILPLADDALMLLDALTGDRLHSLPVAADAQPGNLLQMGETLLWQSSTHVVAGSMLERQSE